MGALALLFLDPEEGLSWAQETIEASRTIGFAWAEAFALDVRRHSSTVPAAPAEAEASYSEALAIQLRLGDQEGAGMSLGGLAQLAAGRGDTVEALDLYRRSLAAFEAVGDRAEEARILSETAGTHLLNQDPVLARTTFLESAQAHTDIASVRGVGLSLIGLAATEALERRPENAVQIAAAAEIYAKEEGIVALYTDDTRDKSSLRRARAALAPDDLRAGHRGGPRADDPRSA